MKQPTHIYRTFILALSAVMAFASCEEVIDVDYDDSQRLVAVNGLPMTDSTVMVNITWSRFFLDNREFEAVDNATVTLDVNGTLYAAAQASGANHWFGYNAAGGDTLTVHVMVPGHDEIVGGTRQPYLPDITTPLAQIDTLQPFTMGEVSFTLTDPVGANYYYVYISERDSGSRWNQWEKKWDTIDTVRNAYFYCLNREATAPEVNSAAGMMDYYSKLLFKDSLIDGTALDMLLAIPMLKDTAEHPIQRDYKLIVESFSREAYRYTIEVMEAQSGASYFAEPRRIYSNLSGNTPGIFAGIAHREFPLTFTYKQPEQEE